MALCYKRFDTEQLTKNLTTFPMEKNKHLSCEWYNGTISESSFRRAMNIRNKILKNAKDIVNQSKAQSEDNFSYYDIINEIVEMTFQSCKYSQGEWAFSKEFKIKFLIHIYGYAVNKMEECLVNYYQRFSLLQNLRETKEHLFKEFSDDCKAANHEVRTAETFVKRVLIKSVILRVKQSMGIQLYNIITKTKTFAHKNRMMYYIHKDLLDRPVNDVIEFANEYSKYVKKWIKERVGKFCVEKEFLKKSLEEIFQLERDDVVNTLQVVTNEANKQHMVTSTWWKALERKLMEKPMIQV